MSAYRKFSSDDPLGYEITLSRDFAAPRELVFRAWTEESRVKEWWGPAGFDNSVCQVDARVGGKMDIHMRGPDGGIYPMVATFHEIVPPERIVFIASALGNKGAPLFDILTTVAFVEMAGKTRLTLTARVVRMVDATGNHVEGMEEGWSGSLDKLVAYISADTSDREILLSREFDAPRELVWEAIVDPKRVVKWWGPNGFTTTIEKMDVRPGGAWKYVMHGPDGTDYANKSIFTEVVKPERIVYVHGGGKEGGPGVQFVSTWTLTAIGEGRTELRMLQVYATPEQRDMAVRVYGAVEGGKQCLARLAEFLSGGNA